MGAPLQVFKQSNRFARSAGHSRDSIDLPDLAKQGRLVTAGSFLGFDRGNRGHVENAACGD
jgi:hypothetical protein